MSKTIYINEEDADKWRRAARLWQEVDNKVNEIRLILMLELAVTEGPAVETLDAALDTIAGNSYMFTPQSEWTGGDSTLEENHKTRAPHIAQGNPTHANTQHKDWRDPAGDRRH